MIKSLKIFGVVMMSAATLIMAGCDDSAEESSDKSISTQEMQEIISKGRYRIPLSTKTCEKEINSYKYLGNFLPTMYWRNAGAWRVG